MNRNRCFFSFPVGVRSLLRLLLVVGTTITGLPFINFYVSWISSLNPTFCFFTVVFLISRNSIWLVCFKLIIYREGDIYWSRGGAVCRIWQIKYGNFGLFVGFFVFLDFLVWVLISACLYASLRRNEVSFPLKVWIFFSDLNDLIRRVYDWWNWQFFFFSFCRLVVFFDFPVWVLISVFYRQVWYMKK